MASEQESKTYIDIDKIGMVYLDEPSSNTSKRKKTSLSNCEYISDKNKFYKQLETNPGSIRTLVCRYGDACINKYCLYSHVRWYNKTCSICGIFTTEYNKHKYDPKHIAALASELSLVVRV
jgi:coproporphyrinogen III oxidase-like Fe-S oxidoreductase